MVWHSYQQQVQADEEKLLHWDEWNHTLMTSKGPVAHGPKQAALKPEPIDCNMVSCLPSPSCLPHKSLSKLFLAQNKHIWLVPFLIMVGVAPDHKPLIPSSLAITPTAWMGPCKIQGLLQNGLVSRRGSGTLGNLIHQNLIYTKIQAGSQQDCLTMKLSWSTMHLCRFFGAGFFTLHEAETSQKFCMRKETLMFLYTLNYNLRKDRLRAKCKAIWVGMNNIFWPSDCDFKGFCASHDILVATGPCPFVAVT